MYPRLLPLVATVGADKSALRAQVPSVAAVSGCSLPPASACRLFQSAGTFGTKHWGRLPRVKSIDFPPHASPLMPRTIAGFSVLWCCKYRSKGVALHRQAFRLGSRLPLLACAMLENAQMQPRVRNDADSKRSALCASPAGASCEMRFYALRCFVVTPAERATSLSSVGYIAAGGAAPCRADAIFYLF